MMLIHMSVSDEEKSGKYGKRVVEMPIVQRNSKSSAKSWKRLANLLL